MTCNIVISGETLTGKTMVAVALAAKLNQAGKSVGYFKPAGEKSFSLSKDGVDVDEDASLMKDLLGLDAELSCICPILRGNLSYDELMRVGEEELKKKIKECYTTVSKGKDIVIVEGTKAPWHLLHVGLSTPQIARMLDAEVISLVNFPDITAIDNILLQQRFFQQFGLESMSIVLNRVPPMLESLVTDEMPAFLKKHGLKFCGTIYQNRELFSPTVRDISRALDGEMVTGDENLDLLIDQFMVGSMAPENALKWFRRMSDGAVITSGDRADICLAALETDTSLLILTGGLSPDIRTISSAKEKEIPIMITGHDTFATSQIVNELIGSISLENKEKVAVIERIVGGALDFACISSLCT